MSTGAASSAKKTARGVSISIGILFWFIFPFFCFFWPPAIVGYAGWFAPLLSASRKLLLSAGLVLLALSGLLFFQAYSFVNHAANAEGIVVTPNSDESKSDSNIISFQTAWGATFHFSYFSGLSPFRVGDRVTVVYDPEDPSGARINSVIDVWGWPLAVLVDGSAALFVGLCFWFAKSPRRIGGVGIELFRPTETLSR